jgi:hypothetical protein
MKTSVLVGTLLLWALVAPLNVTAQSPADGKWEAKVKTQVGEQIMRMNFKSDGAKLTGTVASGQAAETAIEDGQIDGATISFKQTVDLGGSNISFIYTGKLSGDQIVFTREPFKIEFTARRVK